MRRPALTAHAPALPILAGGGLAALPRPLRPRHARRDRPTGKIGRASQGLRGLPAAWPPLAAKTKRGHTTLWYDLLIFLWSERLDSNQRPPAPKAGALPCCATLRDGMFCTQKALLWQGRPVRRPQGPLPPYGRDRHPVTEGPLAFFHTGRVPAADRGALPPPKKELAMPALPCARERSRGSSVPGLPATAIGVSAGPFSRPQPGGRKRKTPLESGEISLWGERWDLNPRPPGPQPGALPTELLPP